MKTKLNSLFLFHINSFKNRQTRDKVQGSPPHFSVDVINVILPYQKILT